MMDVKPIKTEADYEVTLAEIDRLMDADLDSREGDRLDVLVTLVESYEARHYPIEPADPIDTILTVMAAKHHSQMEFAKLIGSRSRASEILNRKRALTVDMIHKISSGWHIPADILVQPYHLESEAPAKRPSQKHRKTSAPRPMKKAIARRVA
jgi:HTH-type transcriptional regulator/antitoxin HigA